MKHHLWNERSLWAMFRKALFLPHRRFTPRTLAFFFKPTGYLSGHLRLEQETRTHFFQRSQPAGPKAAVWNLKGLSGKDGIYRHIAWIEPTPGRILMSQETFRKAPWVCLPAPHKETLLLLQKMCQSRGWKPMGYYQCSLSPAELSLPFSHGRRETEAGKILFVAFM